MRKPDTNGTLLFTQSDRIMRLIPPAGGSFAGAPSNVIATRDDQNTSYSPFSIVPSASTGTPGSPAQFSLAGFEPNNSYSIGQEVVWATMQRGGQVSLSGASQVDLQLGLSSATSGSPSYPVPFTLLATTQPYTSAWTLAPAFDAEIQALFPSTSNVVYQPGLIDLLSGSCGIYSLLDSPELGLPVWTAKNILQFSDAPGGNPEIPQGRTLEITLPWTDPSALDWEILSHDPNLGPVTVVASAGNPNNGLWNVQVDPLLPNCAWITVDPSAPLGVGYEARLRGGAGAGFFDVIAPPSNPTIPVIQSVSVQSAPPVAGSPYVTVVGGMSTTGTVTLDSPAPSPNGAVVSLTTFSPNVSFDGGATQTSVLVQANQRSANFDVLTSVPPSVVAATIFASYNGIQQTTFYVLPASGAGLQPGSFMLSATASTGQVALQWTASTGAQTYTVSRSTASQGPFTPLASGLNSSAQSYTDMSVTNGVTYYYIVTAINLYGATNSNTATATPPSNSALAGFTITPSPVVGGYDAIGTITLATAASTGGATFTVTASTSTGLGQTSWTFTIPAGTTSYSFSIPTTPVNQTDTVTLTAMESASSPPIEMTAQLTIVPPTVIAITFNPNPATNDSYTLATVTLNGAAPSGMTATLSASDPSLLQSPLPTLSFAPGAFSASGNLLPLAVSASTQVTITATSQGVNPSSCASGILVINPFNPNGYYLADLKLCPTGIYVGGTTTGTVSLNQSIPTNGSPINIAVKCFDPNVSINGSTNTWTNPVNVTVQPGNISATFDVGYAANVTDVTYVQIAGSYNTWTQSAQLTVLPILPTRYDLSIQNLIATPGNQCVVLSWQELPAGSVQGYNVYQVINGVPAPQPMNSTPLPSPIFADTNNDQGLTNGVQNSYYVTVVPLQGPEIGGAYASATPVDAPTITWISQPNGSLSGAISLFASSSSGDGPESYLIVDGKVVSGVDLADIITPYPGSLTTCLNTSALANGPHLIRIVGFDGDTACATTAMTIQVANDLSNLVLNSIVETSIGEMVTIQAGVPSGTANWQINILDSTGNIVNTWSASSLSAQLSWDGTSSNGSLVPDGSYTLQLILTDNTGATEQVNQPVNKLNGDPQGIAFITYLYPDYDKKIQDGYAKFLQDNFTSVFLATSGWQGVVFPPTGTIKEDDLKRLMRSANVFYIDTHGQYNTHQDGPAKYVLWGNVLFSPGVTTLKYPGSFNINIPSVLQDVPPDMVNMHFQSNYNIVFIDGCHTAGGLRDDQHSDLKPIPNYDDVGIPSPIWANAFGVVYNPDPLQDFGGFLGFNGVGFANAQPLNSPQGVLTGYPTVWYTWRLSFWNSMFGLIYINQSIYFADLDGANAIIGINPVNDPIYPWYINAMGVTRQTEFGDPLATLTSQ